MKKKIVEVKKDTYRWVNDPSSNEIAGMIISAFSAGLLICLLLQIFR